MAINPMSFAQFPINSEVSPSTWGMLSNLGNVYRDAQQQQAQQQTLSSLGGLDPKTRSEVLIASGVPSLVTLGMNLQQREVENTNAQKRLAILQAQEGRAKAAEEETTAGHEALPETLGPLFPSATPQVTPPIAPAGRVISQDPEALPPPAVPVPSSPSVIGTAEGQRLGIYGPDASTRVAAATPPGAASGGYPALPVYNQNQPSPFETGQLGGTQTAAAAPSAAAPIPGEITRERIQELARNPDTRKEAIELAHEKLAQMNRKQQAVDLNLDAKDKGVQAWIVTGQNFPGGRTGLGTPFMSIGDDGKIHQYQLSSSGGPPIEVQLPPGQRPMTPGELAAQKTEAVSMAKAQSTAVQALPKLEDQVAVNTQALTDLAGHSGRENATGKYRGQLPDNSLLLSQQGIDFRSRFNQAKGQAFLSAFDTLRGAGAISNSEGDAAKAAINRLSTVTSPAEFDAAIKDAKTYYKLGLERLRRQAKGDFSDHPAELRPSDYASGGNRPPITDIFPRK